MVKRVVSIVAVALLCSPAGSAQAVKDRLKKLNIFRNAPMVSLTVEHPPQLGLTISEAVFAPPENDECEGSFVDALLADFVGNGVTVTDRFNIEDLLSEHEFLASGLVDAEDVLKLGQISGADALVIAKVRRCSSDHLPIQVTTVRLKNGRSSSTYTAATTASVRATVQVIDLTTAKIFSAKIIEEDAQLETVGEGRPPYPAKHSAIDVTLGKAVESVHRLFFAWSETRTLNYYDEKQCDLIVAYRLLQAGDIEGANEQAELNLTNCEQFRSNKPKLVAKALYNLGITELLLDRFEAAKETLEESLRLDPNKVTSTTMAEVRRLEGVSEELNASVGKESFGFRSPTGSSDNVSGQLAELIALYRRDLISEEIFIERAALLPVPPGDLETQLIHVKTLLEFGVIDQGEYEKQVKLVLDGSS